MPAEAPLKPRQIGDIRFYLDRKGHATGNPRAVQILRGHNKIENTVRYLGIDIEDVLALSEGTEI